jgi:hypothetical protein
MVFYRETVNFAYKTAGKFLSQRPKEEIKKFISHGGTGNTEDIFTPD